VNQLVQNIENLINDLPVIVGDIILQIGLDGKALIQRRVQEEGKTASGESTGLYSTAYEKKRAKKGRQINFVDVTDTGEMWRSIGFKEKKQNNKESIVTIAGRDEFTQNKINWNSEKKFEILKLSGSEEETLNSVFDEEMTFKILEYLERGVK